MDRKSKFDRRASAKVNEVSVQDDSALAAVLAEVEGIRADVNEVKQYVNSTVPRSENPEDKENVNPTERKIIYGCKDCKAKGINRNCRHCFICGKDNHKACDCPDKNSLNSKRSPLRT